MDKVKGNQDRIEHIRSTLRIILRADHGDKVAQAWCQTHKIDYETEMSLRQELVEREASLAAMLRHPPLRGDPRGQYA